MTNETPQTNEISPHNDHPVPLSDIPELSDLIARYPSAIRAIEFDPSKIYVIFLDKKEVHKDTMAFISTELSRRRVSNIVVPVMDVHDAASGFVFDVGSRKEGGE